MEGTEAGAGWCGILLRERRVGDVTREEPTTSRVDHRDRPELSSVALEKVLASFE